MLTDPLMDRIQETEENTLEGTIDGRSVEEKYLMVKVLISSAGYRIG